MTNKITNKITVVNKVNVTPAKKTVIKKKVVRNKPKQIIHQHIVVHEHVYRPQESTNDIIKSPAPIQGLRHSGGYNAGGY